MYSSRYASHLHPFAIYSRACINVLIRYASVNRAKDCVSVPSIPGGWENVRFREDRGSWIWEEVSLYRGCIGINFYFNSKLVIKKMGVWLLNFNPVPTRQNQGFIYFLITQSGVKTIEYFHCTCMITMGNFLLSLPLWRWTAPTHRRWRCYLKKVTG